MGLTNENQSLSSILAEIKNSIGTAKDSYVRPDHTGVTDAKIKSALDLEALLGVDFTYDRDEIEKIYTAASKDAYQTNMNSQTAAESSYYRAMAAAQDTGLDTIRQQNASAIASGANKGIQAANQLSTILGNSQLASEQANKFTADRQLVGSTYAAQLKEDAKNALAYSNEISNQIGSLSHQLYNDQIQSKTAELAYNQGINTDYAGYQANKYTADSNLFSNIVSSGSGVYNNNQSSIAQIQSALAAAEAQKYAAANSKSTVNYGGGYSVKST